MFPQAVCTNGRICLPVSREEMMGSRLLLPLLAMLAALSVLPDAALAYVGPGAGLSAIGTLVALVGAVLLAIVGFLWYPLKRLIRGLRGTPAAPAPKDGDGGR
jgi:hypothetical protein